VEKGRGGKGGSSEEGGRRVMNREGEGGVW